MNRNLLPGTLLAVGLLVGSAVGAADIPGNSSTRASLTPTGGVRLGELETARDQDWYRVRLEKGETYSASLSVDSAVCAFIELRDARGRLLESASEPDMYVGGWEHTATRTGTHYVVARRCDPKGDPGSEPYQVRITFDCAGDPAATRCVLRIPGKTGNRLVLFYPDFDLWRVQLRAGQSYSFELQAVRLDLRLRTAGGEYLARGKVITGFVPTRSGTYYLEVISDEDEVGSYSIVARQP